MGLFDRLKAAFAENGEVDEEAFERTITTTQTVSTKKPRKTRKGSKNERIEMLETLSPREGDVFALLIEGYTLRQVAKQLGLSYSTVNTHQTKLYKKLGVTSRAELIILYRELAKAFTA